MPNNPILRGRTFYLKRRVPSRYADVEPRPVIWESLRIDSKAVALSKREQVWNHYLEGWRAKLAGHDGDAEARFRAATNLAERRDYAFLMSDVVAKFPLLDLLERVEAVSRNDGDPDPVLSEAVLGGVEEPGLMLSGLVARVEEISQLENRFKSSQQMRLWRNDRKRSVRHLMEAIGGDCPVVQVGVAEARLHCKRWQERPEVEKLRAESAN